MKYFIPPAFIAATFLLFACDNKQASENREPIDKKGVSNEVAPLTDAEDVTKYDEAEKAANGFYSDTTGNPQINIPRQERKQQPEPAKENWDKKIIKTATLNLQVKEHDGYYKSLREKVNSFGGYVAQEEQSQSEYKIETTLSIKVPVDQFDNAVARLTEDIETLNEKKISSQDVTTAYIDTKSRMEAKKQVRLRYMDLLKQAKNMEDILSVQSEINNIQEEIEAGAGRMEYLGHSAAFSTINLTCYQVLDAAAAKNTDRPSLVTRIGNAFKGGWNFIGEFFVGLISVWPLYVVAFAFVFVYKKWKRTARKQAA